MQFSAPSKTTVPLALLLALSQSAAWATQSEGIDARLNPTDKQRVQQNDSNYQPITPIPSVLIGNWVVSKIVTAQTASCWDEKQAQQLIGNKISYKAGNFSWGEHQLRNLGITVSTVEAQEFVEDNSGSSAYIDFPMLGIDSPSVQQVIIQHQDVSQPGITDQGGEGIPGDNVLVKNRNTLIFAQCGVWYEVQRQKK